jgi:hypothetical protein
LGNVTVGSTPFSPPIGTNGLYTFTTTIGNFVPFYGASDNNYPGSGLEGYGGGGWGGGNLGSYRYLGVSIGGGGTLTGAVNGQITGGAGATNKGGGGAGAFSYSGTANGGAGGSGYALVRYWS